MKLNSWIVNATAVCWTAAALAQAPAAPPPSVAPLPPAPSESTEANPPAAKPEKAKAAPKKPAVKKKTEAAKPEAKKAEVKKTEIMEVSPPASATIKDEVVNLRGQPSFVGEVIGHLKKGETVVVDQTITPAKHAKDEPAEWDRIAMPTNIMVWVDAQFIDSTTHTVKSKKLNMRGGPGENYSVVGQLAKGDAVTEARREKGWIAMAPPTNAYAFVAAECLTTQAAPTPVVAAIPAPAPPPPAVVQVPVEAPAPVAARAPEPVAPPPVVSTPPPAAPTPAPAPAPAPVAAPVNEKDAELAALRKAMEQPTPTVSAAEAAAAPVNPEARIVTREGFLHRAYNMQAPTDFALHDIKTGDLIEYIQPAPGENLKIFVGTRISATGAEVMDPRWPKTPVLQVKTVDLLP